MESLRVDVVNRVKAICPESEKIPDASVGVFVEDALFDCVKAFRDQDKMVKIRAASYLAAHYCTVNLFQRSQTYPEENFQEVGSGEVGVSGAGSIKTNAYKDKKQEFFEKRTSTSGNAIIKWGANVTESSAQLAGTSYGQEFLRLLKLYAVTEPLLAGNDLNESLGRSPADYPGERYRRW